MRSVMSSIARRVSIVIVCLCCVSAAASSKEETSLQQVKALQQAAHDAVQQNNRDAAEAIYTHIIRDNPQTQHALEAQCEIALLHLHHGEQAQADAAMEKMWDYRNIPGTVNALHHIKSQYWMAGYRDASQSLCERIYSAYPDSPLAAVILADHIRGSIVLKDMETARRGMDTLWTQHSDHERAAELLAAIKTEYWLQGHRQESQALCERIITAYPDDPATASVLSDYLCGRIAMGQDADIWQDVEAFWSRYQTHPEFIVMAHRIAHHYHHSSGDIGRALELNQRLVKLFPIDEKTIAPQRDIIVLYLEMGAKEMADAQLQQLLTTYADHPSLPAMLNEAGDACRRHGHYADAIRLFEAALALEATEAEVLSAYAGLAKAQIQRGTTLPDPNEVTAFAKAEILSPEMIIDQLVTRYTAVPRVGFHVFQIAEEYYFRGEHLMKTGQPEAGKLAFETAIRLWKHNKVLPDRHHAAMAAYYAGVASGYVGDAFSALGYYQEVARNYPEYDKAWHARFMVAEQADKLEAIGQINRTDAVALQLTAYQEILDNDPNSPVDSIVRQRVQILSR